MQRERYYIDLFTHRPVGFLLEDALTKSPAKFTLICTRNTAQNGLRKSMLVFYVNAMPNAYLTSNFVSVCLVYVLLPCEKYLSLLGLS